MIKQFFGFVFGLLLVVGAVFSWKLWQVDSTICVIVALTGSGLITGAVGGGSEDEDFEDQFDDLPL